MAVSLEKKPLITEHRRATKLLSIIEGEKKRPNNNGAYAEALLNAEASLNNLKRFW